jgi:hypothetical protein
MKQTLFIAVLIFIKSGVSFSHENETSSFSDPIDRVKRYCSDANTEHSSQCLMAYLSYRCIVNHGLSQPLFVSNCISATKVLVDELDLTQVQVDQRKNINDDPLQLKQVAFTHSLQNQFLKDSDLFAKMVDRYLDGLDRSYRFQESHSLWLQTLAESHGKKEEALKKMTTLFQDFVSTGYLEFLEETATHSKNKKQSSLILQNTRKFADFYIPFVENRIKQNRVPLYSIYPEVKGVNDMSPIAHHFYTPALLAMKLKKRGFDEAVSFHAAFLFNTAYEFIKLDRKMKTNRWPLKDPISFSAEQYALQVQKIYTGYLGALYGIGRSNKAIHFQYFSQKLSEDPSAFVSQLHLNGF